MMDSQSLYEVRFRFERGTLTFCRDQTDRKLWHVTAEPEDQSLVRKEYRFRVDGFEGPTVPDASHLYSKWLDDQ